MRTIICVNSYNLFYFPLEKQGDSTKKYNLFFFTAKIMRLLTL